MLNLEELVFKVNTKELVDAVTDLKSLSQAVTDLGTKSASVNVKVNKTTAEVKSQAKAVKEATEETNKSTSALQRQQDILNFMTQGFSKGQSSVLAYAKAAGAATSEITELGKVLDRQRTLMGTDPFDKSIGAMKALKNEYTVLREVNRLYNAELNLSKNQMNELAREKLRLIEKLKIEGRSFTDVKNALRDLNIAYIQNANAENTLDANMRRRQKTTQDTAKANEYLAKEMERVNRMLGNTDNVTSTTNNKLIRFEQELKRSGMTAAQQTVALEKYKKALLEIQQAGGNRQVDYLSRALGPQITDVFVGLATGQSPLMVLLQQGGQLRDQFALAGVAGSDMGKMLTTAATTMIASVKDVAMAVGGLLLNAIVATGKAIANLPLQILKSATDSLSGMFTFIKSGGKDTSALAESFSILSANLSRAALYAGGFAAAIGIAFIAATKDINDLNRNLVMTGASLGLTAKDAYEFAKGMDSSGVSTFKAVNALSAFAKEGVRPADGALKDLIKTAVELESVGGPSVKKTAETLSEIGKSPVEALAKFAAETGVVDVAILKQVQSLEKQKKYTEAAELAQRAFIEGSKELSATMAANLTPVEKLWISIKKATSDAWSEVKEFANSDTFLKPFKLTLETVWVLISEFWFVLKAIGTEIGGITAQFSAMGEAGGVFTKEGRAAWTTVGEEVRNDAVRARKEQDAYTKSIIDGTIFQNQEMKKTGQQLRANSDAARNFMKELKDKDGKTASGSLGAASDNSIANVEKRFNIQLQLAKNFAKDELDIQKAKLDTGLITQEEYYNNTIGLITESEQKQLAVVEQFSAEYEKAVQDRMVQLSSALTTTFKNNRGLKEETAKNAEATEQYGQAVENVLTALGTFQEKMQAIKDAAKSSAMVREFQAVAKLHKALQDSAEALRKYSEESTKIKEDADKELRNLDLRVALMGKTEEEQKAINREWALQNRLTEIQLSLERRLREIRNDPKLAGNAMDSAVAEYEAIEAAKQQRIAANREVAVSAAEDMDREFNRIRDSISDAIVTALFEGGKSGRKKLRDLLVAELKKPITMVVNVAVNAMLNSLMGSIGGGSSGGSGGNSLSALSSLFGAGGFSGAMTAGAGWMTGAASLSQIWGAGTSLMGTGSLAGILSGGSMLLGSIMPVLGVLSLLSGTGTPGEQHTGAMTSTRGSALDMATAMSITSGREGASRDLTTRYNADLAKVIKPIVEGAMTGVNSALTGLGMGGYTIDAGFAANTNGKGKNKNAFGYFNIYDEAGNIVKEYVNRELGTDLTAAIQKFGGDIQEAVASVVLEGSNFKREGETNAQTLNRLSTSLIAVNQVIDLLGGKSIDLSLAGGDAASSLVDLFGSIENLKSASQSFYDQFANDTIKLADAQKRLDTTFADLNLSIPATTDEYYALVQGLDLSTEAGRKAYAALIGVGNSFLFVADAAKRAKEEAQRRQEEAQREAERAYQEAERAREEAERLRKEGIQKAFDLLGKSVSKQKSALQAQYDLAKQVYDIASQAVRELRGQVGSSNQMLIGEARSLLESALTSGQLPDPKLLGEAISKVREELENTQYKSKVEQEKATLLLSNDLEKLAAIAEPHMTTAELQLQQLQLILEQQKALVDAALGNTEAVLSVEQAIANLASALIKPATPTTGTSGGSSGGSNSGGGGSGFVVGGGGGGSATVYDTEAERLAANIAAWEASGKDWKAVYLPSGGLTIVGDSAGKPVSDQEKKWLQNAGVPGFANGGAFTNGIVSEPTAFNMAVMGEAGSEAIMPLTNVGGSLGVRATNDPAVVEAIERMNSNLEMLRAEIRADVSHNAKTSRLLDRVIQDGRTISVTADLDGGTI